MSFADRLRDLRTNNRYSQEQLAEKMCVSRRTGEFRNVLTLIQNQFFPSDDVETSNRFFNCVNY